MRSFSSYMYFKSDGVIFDKTLIRIKSILWNGKITKSVNTRIYKQNHSSNLTSKYNP